MSLQRRCTKRTETLETRLAKQANRLRGCGHDAQDKRLESVRACGRGSRCLPPDSAMFGEYRRPFGLD